ncbi:MAG: hypothetical protein ACXV5Q_02810 [Frankiaceae bacterium]
MTVASRPGTLLRVLVALLLAWAVGLVPVLAAGSLSATSALAVTYTVKARVTSTGSIDVGSRITGDMTVTPAVPGNTAEVQEQNGASRRTVTSVALPRLGGRVTFTYGRRPASTRCACRATATSSSTARCAGVVGNLDRGWQRPATRCSG